MLELVLTRIESSEAEPDEVLAAIGREVRAVLEKEGV